MKFQVQCRHQVVHPKWVDLVDGGYDELRSAIVRAEQHRDRHRLIEYRVIERQVVERDSDDGTPDRVVVEHARDWKAAREVIKRRPVRPVAEDSGRRIPPEAWRAASEGARATIDSPPPKDDPLDEFARLGFPRSGGERAA